MLTLGGQGRDDELERVWTDGWPRTERALAPRWQQRRRNDGPPTIQRDLCIAPRPSMFKVAPSVGAGRTTPEQARNGTGGCSTPLFLSGVPQPQPIVDEELLPRSAAGIFASNLTDGETMDEYQGGVERDADRTADVMGKAARMSPRKLNGAEGISFTQRGGVGPRSRISSDRVRLDTRAVAGDGDVAWFS